MKRIAALCLVALLAAPAAAQDEQKPETVLDGLSNPTAVAVQPDTGHVFVSDSGAGRVIRVVDGKAQDVITGFPKDVYGKGPKYDIGPLGLAFLDKKTLVVGGGGLKDGEELLRVYEVPDAGKPAIKADAMKSKFALPAEGDIKGEGNFYGLAVTKTGIYVTCNGDDTKGWISKAERDGTTVKSYKRHIATKEATEVDAPVGITVSVRGELVVAQMGEVTVPGDSLLTFYDEKGKKLANFETGLSDLAGLAYSPRGGLYTVDFAWAEPKEGGLFKLIAVRKDGKQTVKPKKIAGLDKPSALVFDSKGALYVTIFGTAEGDKKGGKLLRFKAGL